MPSIYRPMPTPSLEIVCDAAPHRPNEDTWLAMQASGAEGALYCAAIDGVTARLTPPKLQQYLAALPGRPSSAAYAAGIVRDTLARHIVAGTPSSPRALLLEANAALERAMRALFGELTLEALELPPESYAMLRHDPRLVRVALPACVATLIAYDPTNQTLCYAHAGDTALMVVYQDGHVQFPTAGPSDFDRPLKRTAQAEHATHPDMTYRELTQQPAVQRYNLRAALHHNYVDEHGLPQPAQGIGVLDGLPELRYFVSTGTLSLDQVAWVAVMSDGLGWPANAQEVFTEDTARANALRAERWAFMAQEISATGLAGYLHTLREAEAADPDFERYPRMKLHDDATGVLLRFAD